jgi:hypothetical protein
VKRFARLPLCPAIVAALALVGPLARPPGLWAAAPDGQYVRDWLVAGPVSAEMTTITKVVTILPRSVLPVPEEGRSFRLLDGQLTWNR